MQVRKRKRVGRWLLLATVILFTLYVVVQYGIFGPKQAGIVQGKLDDPDFSYTPWVYFLTVHITFGTIAFVTGPFQFLKKPTGLAARMHRRLGYVYIVSIALGGLSGLYLAYYATGGPITGTGFLMLDLLWLATTGMALLKVVRKKFLEHQQWMMRSYAVTLAFVTFRLLLLPLQLAAQLSLETAMHIAAWLCWIVNLIIVEIMIRRKGASKWETPRSTSSSA